MKVEKTAGALPVFGQGIGVIANGFWHGYLRYQNIIIEERGVSNGFVYFKMHMRVSRRVAPWENCLEGHRSVTASNSHRP